MKWSSLIKNDKRNNVLVIFVVALCVLCVALNFIFPLDLSRFHNMSPVLYDRNGELISCRLNKDEKWQLPITKEQVDPTFIRLLIETEDKRFYTHPGVDVISLFRASLSALTSLKIKSGGSTLTMQVAKLLEPRPRTITTKLIDIFRAIQLEIYYSKNQILQMYLTLAPYGGNIQGIQAASYCYFGKEPANLKLSEASLLVALPQAPTKLLKNKSLQKQRRDFILKESTLPRNLVQEATSEPVPAGTHSFPRLAQHVSHYFLEDNEKKLTLDRQLQEKLEHLLSTWPTEKFQSTAVLIAHKSGEILAYVGSKDYFDHEILGQVDVLKSIRSPGSTLKPFIYGLAFEEGFLHPGSIMKDVPLYFDGYTPTNFKDVFHGDITVHEALRQSLNIPVVSVLEKLGSQYFMSTLQGIGVRLILPQMYKRVSLPIALGGVGVKLIELAALFNTLNNEGYYRPLYFFKEGDEKAEMLFSAKTTKRLLNILSNAPLPESIGTRPMGAGKIAYKTGTSYGHRDALAVGVDGEHVVLVWFGRADGAPVPSQVGLKTAAPLLLTIFDRILLSKGIKENLEEDPVPTKLRHFNREITDALAIQFPSNDAILKKGGTYQFKLAGGSEPYAIFINGKRIKDGLNGFKGISSKLVIGFHNLLVIDGQGNRAESYFQVQ